MSSSYEVLIDSDAFVALFLPDDLLHAEAQRIYESLKARGATLATTNLVISETATVLSHRAGQKEAKKFLERMEQMVTIFVDEMMEADARRLFKRQEKKGTSMVDCANYVVVNQLRIAKIFSFDGFYKRNWIPRAE